VQQGSAPQIAVVAKLGLAVPAGNQQQQPLQSVHVAICVSAMHSVLHDEAASGVDVAASVVLMVPLLLPELLLVPELLLLLEEVVVPLLLLEEVVVPLLLLVVAPESVSVPPLEPDPLSSLEEPVGVLELLLQAASPTVDDVPMTTMTWKSFSMFMTHTLPPIGGLVTEGDVSRLDSRGSSTAHLRRFPNGGPFSLGPPHQAAMEPRRSRPRVTCRSW
jgi:hypothetical protein